jgi:methylated-DNA-[protein]-cysteine S-methyltransferase
LPIVHQIKVSTPLGHLIIQSRNDFLIRISLDPDQDILSKHLLTPERYIPGCLFLARDQLLEYFQGLRKEFDFPYQVPVTNGYKKIYDTLLHLPYGKITTYSELAHQSGLYHGARVVGAAMAKNPLPILIPCHRVIRRNGTIGDYSLGGTQKKSLLLQLEGLPVIKERL